MVYEAKINSTCVQKAIYDSNEKVLSITYPSGDTYDYIGVPMKEFYALQNAPSAGRYVNAVIKPTYSFAGEIS